MSVLSSTPKRRRYSNKVKLKEFSDHDEFLSRIEKTLYYGEFPVAERFSLPVSELAAEIYTQVKSKHSFESLSVEEAAEISRNACVSPCSLILALLYLDRLKSCNPNYIERVPPSEMFVASMMIASKFLNDDGEEDEVFNSEWAKSADISLKDINKYEKDFLNAINWEVFVKENEFWTRLKNFECELAKREGRRRGWFTYMELKALLDFIDVWSLAHTLVVLSVACITSYTACVMTLVGSVMLVSHINVPALIIPSIIIQTPVTLPIETNTTKCFKLFNYDVVKYEDHFNGQEMVLSGLISNSNVEISSSWLDYIMPGNNNSFNEMVGTIANSYFGINALPPEGRTGEVVDKASDLQGQFEFISYKEEKEFDDLTEFMNHRKFKMNIHQSIETETKNGLLGYFRKSQCSSSEVFTVTNWFSNVYLKIVDLPNQIILL